MPAVTKSKTKDREIKARLLLMALFAFLTVSMLPNAKAQQSVDIEVIESVELDQAELDQILAPIALYPDSLLSQILVASTYPLEVVQATRWRQANPDLDESEVLNAIDNMEWDPSVKALTPFTDLLVRISDDLNWLQRLGDAFLQNEDQVLASVQNLRQKAYDNGSIADNEYFDVIEEDDNIIIESTKREIIYVPYYDTREVYGRWWWNGYDPIYWDRPRGYVHSYGGFYWNTGFYVRPNIFYGGFHWGTRHLVVNHYYYNNPYNYNGYSRNIHISKYQRWSHNPVHRRGVRYPQAAVKGYVQPNRNINSGRNVNTVRKTPTTVVKRPTDYRRVGQTNANVVKQKLDIKKQQATRNVGVVDRRAPTKPSVVDKMPRSVPQRNVVKPQVYTSPKQRSVNQNSVKSGSYTRGQQVAVPRSSSNSTQSVTKTTPQRKTTNQPASKGKWSR